MKCIDFFSKNYGNTQICKLIQNIRIDELIAWELEIATKLSPGPVNNKEFLYRQIISPIHYDKETNTLTPTAFNDVSDKGLSVNRLTHTTEEKIRQMANNRVEDYNKLNPDKPTRSFSGAVSFLCEDIRNITVPADPTPLRGCLVFDTAYENDLSHADICQAVKDKAHARSVRASIRDLANKYLETKPFLVEA